MMSILERKFAHGSHDEDLLARNCGETGKTYALTREWFVVVRRRTASRWKKNSPSFSEHARLLAFEDIIDAYGGEHAFNALVAKLLDVDYYQTWFGGVKSE